ncbi:DUF4202 domain-containing protein [Solitalea sp. MAHUQ-68]|uniref:DUF4202 domain-containing protein n=1 Tax=Solitalea agri TaxID=2953739 RepID=A0A9X2JEB6_9SPHI|nr:DUF4202 domain-containing protein [Solitalea agri]MCO4292211.1 DUF4202 domain-containing protein [Solitalea agri]
MTSPEKLTQAFAAFDAYNANDPNKETFEGKEYPKEVLYAIRMTEQLNKYEPNAPDYVQLAARCQHIGRWESPRNSFPMDRKGYLMWRTQLYTHHATIAAKLLTDCGFDNETIEKVKFLLQKKQLAQNPDTQLLEDVICLVFVHYYLDHFAAEHEDEKIVEILQKTIRKMTPKAVQATLQIPMTDKVRELIMKAAG